MNKKGFTLIELLAVIVILSIIVLITTVTVNSILFDSRKSLSDSQIKNIENAAKTYYLKEGMNKNDMCVSIDELLNKGYIEGSSIKNPESNENIDGYVKISYASNQYSYKYQEESCVICSVEQQDLTKYSVGDEVTCTLSESTDKFYVIEETQLTNTNIKLLTEKKLDIATYRQSDNKSTIEFSTTNYWSDITEYPADVYNENNDKVKPIVDNYVSYINKKLTGVEGSLLTYQQAIDLGCDSENNTCSEAPTWVYSFTYWLGSAYDNSRVGFIHSNGTFGRNTYDDNLSFNVRPVITVPTNYLDKK